MNKKTKKQNKEKTKRVKRIIGRLKLPRNQIVEDKKKKK